MKIYKHIQVVASRVKPKLVISMMLLSITSVVVLNSQLANAAVYKKVDADGNVSFSDVPDKNAKLISVPPLATVPAMSPELIASTLDGDPQSANARQESYILTITSPTPDQTYQRGIDSFSPSVQVKPDLKNGDQLVQLLDGKVPNDNSTENMDRGQHIFEAKVINASGRTLVSKSVTFNVLQNHVKQQARTGTKN